MAQAKAVSASIRGTLQLASRQPRLPRVGERADLLRRFSAADVGAFAELSGDGNPLHVNAAFAADPACNPRFHDVPGGPCIVHGILVASCFSAIFGSLYPGAAYHSQQLRFVNPVPVGATVLASVEVTHVRKRVRAVTCATRVLVLPFDGSCNDFSEGAAAGAVDEAGFLAVGAATAIDGEAVVLLPRMDEVIAS